MENQTLETMEIRDNRVKRRIALIAAVMCIIAVVATGTLAYFTAEETAYNVITTGVLSMDLVEETTGGKPFPEEGVSGVMPGEAIDKIVYVVNDGGVDMYVRIAIDKEITGENGRELNFENITLDINTAKWTEKDGFYYYNSVLEPGEQTEPLFTAVTFGAELGNEYMNARVQIDVNAQAVQSRNNGGNALEATGWSAAE